MAENNYNSTCKLVIRKSIERTMSAHGCQRIENIHCVSKKTSPMFLAITRESIVGFS